ncbi:hypothetical protein [Taklimakanibacter albus]|uniref:Uncharacterized protein n=1 Tax=Taklimakanibacter albus TaxID=2800327 RepID=A0ACC5RGJ0_9HYPH|nr:hypothetical protein [Aestuariivirga sp. YIM B02566]MBK1871585.1 hypothetical protein [Aestuariivirga sp. YIM B02566]
MAFAFDTLGYSQRLRDAGIKQAQAEAHAEAARDFIMAELVTRKDLETALKGQSQGLIIWLGSMMIVAVGILATLIKLL